MTMVRSSSIVKATLMCVCVAFLLRADGVNGAAQDVQQENVHFPAAETPSSTPGLQLHGTLWWDAAKSFPKKRAVMFLTGSGAADRYETERAADGSITDAMYHDIAEAVSADCEDCLLFFYDKRSCSNRTSPLCPNEICAGSVTENCINSSQITFGDFVADGLQAVKYLLSRTDIFRGNISVVGHSQGCDVASEVARSAPFNVDSLLLLMGGGVPLDAIYKNQASVQHDYFSDVLAYWEAQPPSPTRTAQIAYLQGHLQAYECTMKYAEPQMDLLRDGTIAPTAQHAVVCSLGVYYAGRVFCPASCGSHVCRVGSNSDQCLYGPGGCREGAAVGACSRPLFPASWLTVSEPGYRRELLSVLDLSYVASINSDTDLKVPAITYEPLQKLYTAAPGVKKYEPVVISGITHQMVPFLGMKSGVLASGVLPAVNASSAVSAMAGPVLRVDPRALKKISQIVCSFADLDNLQ